MSVTERAYIDGFATVRSVIDFDELTLQEVVEALDPDRLADPRLTPWKRGYQAAIRAALGR